MASKALGPRTWISILLAGNCSDSCLCAPNSCWEYIPAYNPSPAARLRFRDAASWERTKSLIWVLIGPLFLDGPMLVFLTMGLSYLASSHLPPSLYTCCSGIGP